MRACLWLIALIALPALLIAHPGGLDAMGGHYNKKTGEYHLHNKGIEDATRTIEQQSDDWISKALLLSPEKLREKFPNDRDYDHVSSAIFPLIKKEQERRKKQKETIETLAAIGLIAIVALVLFNGAAKHIILAFFGFLTWINNDFGYKRLPMIWHKRIVRTFSCIFVGTSILFFVWLVSFMKIPTSDTTNQLAGFVALAVFCYLGALLVEVNGQSFVLNACCVAFPVVGWCALFVFAALAPGPAATSP